MKPGLGIVLRLASVHDAVRLVAVIGDRNGHVPSVRQAALGERLRGEPSAEGRTPVLQIAALERGGRQTV